MPLHFNIGVRVVICLGLAFFAKNRFPEVTYAGLFNIFQMCLLLSLCIVPMAWDKICLVADIDEKQNKLRETASQQVLHQYSRSFHSAIDRATNALELATAIEDTSVEKLSVYRFAKKFCEKRARKIQEGLFKSLIPALLLSGGILILAIVVGNTPKAAALPNDLTSFANLTQACIGAISFSWTIGLLYGEVELVRELANSA